MTISSPPLTALRVFISAASHLSFLKAASELNVTPGAVSRQIQQLEQFLGTTLFTRGHRQVSLTVDGENYFNQVAEHYQAIAQATETFVGKMQANPLNVASYPTFSLRWLIPRWADLEQAHPNLTVDLQTRLQPVNFERENIDISIQMGDKEVADKDVISQPIVGCDLIPVCSPEFAASHPLHVETDLLNVKLLSGQERPKDWEKWFQSLGIIPPQRPQTIRFENLGLTYQAAIEGLGVAMGIRALIVDDLKSGKLVAPFVHARQSSRCFCVTYPKKHRHNPSVIKFVRWITKKGDFTPLSTC
jgi:LysR family transcriptional regulator, glycine cleavage system transcriptional activator